MTVVAKLERKVLADMKVPIVPVRLLEVTVIKAAAKFTRISLWTGKLFWVA